MARQAPDAQRPAASGGAEASKPKKGRRKPQHAKKKRTHRVLLAAIIVVSLLVVMVGGAAGYTWYLNNKVKRIEVKGLTVAPTKGVGMGTENILLVGSTSRCALSVQATIYGLCSQGVDGVNSDVVMILHLNPSVPSVSILSIPRDLFVPNARAEGAYKIDAALFEGAGQLVNAVEEDFGIPIQHFVELNFDSFGNVVSAPRLWRWSGPGLRASPPMPPPSSSGSSVARMVTPVT